MRLCPVAYLKEGDVETLLHFLYVSSVATVRSSCCDNNAITNYVFFIYNVDVLLSFCGRYHVSRVIGQEMPRK